VLRWLECHASTHNREWSTKYEQTGPCRRQQSPDGRSKEQKHPWQVVCLRGHHWHRLKHLHKPNPDSILRLETTQLNHSPGPKPSRPVDNNLRQMPTIFRKPFFSKTWRSSTKSYCAKVIPMKTVIQTNPCWASLLEKSLWRTNHNETRCHVISR